MVKLNEAQDTTRHPQGHISANQRIDIKPYVFSLRLHYEGPKCRIVLRADILNHDRLSFLFSRTRATETTSRRMALSVLFRNLNLKGNYASSTL